MTYRQIETSREVRLWLRDIVLPVGITAVALLANEDTRRGVVEKAKAARLYFLTKILKHESL